MFATNFQPSSAISRRETPAESSHANQSADRLSRAFERMLAGYEPSLLDRAKSVVSEQLLGFGFPERKSRLTCDGYPIELAFNSHERSLRLTCEAGNSISKVAAACERISGRHFETDLLSKWESMLHDSPLRWGAWLGIGWKDLSRCFTKIYVEVPSSRQFPSWQCALPWISQTPKLSSDCGTQIRMLALSVDGQFELYGRVTGLHPWELRSLMHPIGLASYALPLRERLEELCGAALHRQLPCSRMGFSYAVQNDRPPSFTLYAFANNLLGSDREVRSKVLGYANSRHINLQAYEQCSEPLATYKQSSNSHGMVGLSIDCSGESVLRISLAPPKESSEVINHD